MAGNLYFKSLGPDSKEESGSRTPVGQARVIGTEFHLSVARKRPHRSGLRTEKSFSPIRSARLRCIPEQQAVIEAPTVPWPSRLPSQRSIRSSSGSYYPAVLDLEDLPERLEEILS
jgi:hypothetical protein